MPRFIQVLALAGAWLVGCGDDAAGPPDGPAADGSVDAAIDAAMLDRDACPTSYAPAFITDTINVPNGNTGFDLDGDGRVDNELSQIRTVLNPTLHDDIQKSPFLLIRIERLDDPQNDPDAQPVLYLGLDADGDPNNNFSGAGQFWFTVGSVDWQCQPLATLPTGQLSNGQFTAQSDRATLPLSLATLDIRRAHVTGTVAADLSSLSGVLVGGAATPCGLSRVHQTITNQTVLDLLVANFNLQPDIDLDGDGKEQFVASPSAGVYACIDGDGTRIDGADCPCDPRIIDGFSVALQLTAVKAEILGPAPVDAGTD